MMDKREFLKASGALLAGGVAARMAGGGVSDAKRTNWSGNYEFHAKKLDTPATVDEVRKLVKSGGKLKAVGSAHSFNSIADSPGDQVSLKSFEQMKVDPERRTVTVGAGVKYGQVAPYLYEKGFALHNLASLPHISVAGACSTATHGSGNRNGNLSTAVSGIEMVNGAGELVRIERGGDGFDGAVVGLGALGVMTSLTLDVQPKYDMTQVVYENLSFDRLKGDLDEIFSSGYSVSLFTDWQKHRATQVWIKRRLDQRYAAALGPDFFGASRATKKLHPISGHPAESCTEQMGIPGPWYERLPHFRMNFTPSSGNELQTEYFVARENGYEAIEAVESLRDRITPLLFVTEFRTIDADKLWLSPCYERASMTIHFTWKPEWPAVRDLLPRIEEKLAPFQPRPHWAKLFTIDGARVRAQYAKLGEFLKLAARYDARGEFQNEFLKRTVFG